MARTVTREAPGVLNRTARPHATKDGRRAGAPRVASPTMLSRHLTLTAAQKSVSVPGGGRGTAKLKATASQARSIKKGAKLFLNVQARGADGGIGQARKTIKVG
jgi:hypothetical protein